MPILCEIQKKVQIIYAGDCNVAVELEKRLRSAELGHSDNGAHQMGIADGENYAVYVDLGGLYGTLSFWEAEWEGKWYKIHPVEHVYDDGTCHVKWDDITPLAEKMFRVAERSTCFFSGRVRRNNRI